MGTVSRLIKAGIVAALAACLILLAGSGVKELYRFYGGKVPPAHPPLSEWNLPRAGEWVLPARVQAMLALLRDNRVQEFRFSDAIARDPDDSVPQRLAEGAYPIRVNAEARHRLLNRGEALPPGCRVVAGNQGVVLADCG